MSPPAPCAPAPHIDCPPDHATFAAIGLATPAELVAFAHATLFSPALSTLQTALHKDYLTNFPSLTELLLRKHPPQSVAMVKGHLDQTRMHWASTKLQLGEPSSGDTPFPCTTNTKRSHHCYTAIMEPTGQTFTDQTGKFVQPSSNGNNYLLILYGYDSNSILAEPLKTRTAKAILTAYQILHKKLRYAGLRPKLQRLDNECSKILKQFMTKEDVDYQLVPPGIHQRNSAERAI